MGGERADVDVRLHAVRPRSHGQARWSEYGTELVDGVTELHEELSDDQVGQILAEGGLKDVAEMSGGLRATSRVSQAMNKVRQRTASFWGQLTTSSRLLLTPSFHQTLPLFTTKT